MPQTFDEMRVRSLMKRAFGEGALLRGTTLQWDISAGCADPVVREIRGMKGRDIRETLGEEGRMERRFAGDSQWSGLELLVRCRKCTSCARYRQRLWRLRCQTELGEAYRSWFGTLTLSPHSHSLALMRAQHRAAKSGSRWETDLSEAERFRARVNACSPLITKFFKRLRKGNAARGFDPAEFRYCVVAESHKSGLPHFHLLLHEVSDEHPARKRSLEGQWEAIGYSSWRLATPAAAGYVTKYLTKSALASIRASLHYGQQPPGRNPPVAFNQTPLGIGDATHRRETIDPPKKTGSPL